MKYNASTEILGFCLEIRKSLDINIEHLIILSVITYLCLRSEERGEARAGDGEGSPSNGGFEEGE